MRSLEVRSYFLLRMSTVGVGYVVSLLGIATGAAYGTAIAFFDFIRPASGTIDLFAVRTRSGTKYIAFLAVKLFMFIACLIFAAYHFGGVVTSLLLIVYLSYLWWATFASVGIIRTGRYIPVPYKAFFSKKFCWLSIKLFLKEKNFFHLLATSTFGALCYSSFYLYLNQDGHLFGLRAIDGTLFAISFYAQRIIRGTILQIKAYVIILAIVLTGSAITLFFSTVYLQFFCILKALSMLCCARAMHFRKDKSVSINQTLLGGSYCLYNILATSPQQFVYILICEVCALGHLWSRCKNSSNA